MTSTTSFSVASLLTTDGSSSAIPTAPAPTAPAKRNEIAKTDPKVKRQHFYFNMLYDLSARDIPFISVNKAYEIYIGSSEFRLGSNKTETIFNSDNADFFREEQFHDSTHQTVLNFFIDHPHPERPEEVEQYQYRRDDVEDAIELFEDDLKTIVDENDLNDMFKIQPRLISVDASGQPVFESFIVINIKWADMTDALKERLRGGKSSLFRNRKTVSTNLVAARIRRLEKKVQKQKELEAKLLAERSIKKTRHGKVTKTQSKKGKERA